jgi:phosphoglycerate dehydrogenase-like enzyme
MAITPALNRSAQPWVFERDLIVTSSSGRSAPVLADHAILFMLLFAFSYPACLDAQRQHRWDIPRQDRLRGLFGQMVGIIRLGNTGRALALPANAMGMRVPKPGEMANVPENTAGPFVVSTMHRRVAGARVVCIPCSALNHAK